MDIIKKIFRTKFSRIWLIVTACVLIFLLVANILLNTVLYEVICNVFGRERAVISEEQKNMSPADYDLYPSDYDSKEEAFNAANAVNERINEEGIVLVKNQNALPLAQNAKVSVFGKNSVNLVYGGSGSGGGDSASAKTLYDSLKAAGISYNTELKAFYDGSSSGSGRTPNPKIENSGNVTLSTGETPVASYSSALRGSFANYNDAALVVFSRIGGEGFDLPRTMKGAAGARNESDHYLQLDKNETDLLKMVCDSGFKHVIVIINSSAAMELGFLDDPTHYAYNEKIDGCLWIGAPGSSGIMALGRVLNGSVNPSGRLVDTYARNFKDMPSWNNFSNNFSDTGDRYTYNGKNYYAFFVDYEEGIYVGYKYYETRGAEGVVGGEGDEWYKNNVVYPFGYGLSYTDFEWEIENADELEGLALTAESEITVKVKVTNTGDVAGKDVVQLYCTPEYISGGIEKAHVNLCDFAKTPMLYPASEANNSDKPNSCTVELKVSAYDIASYDYSDANKNGKKTYELDAGAYTFKVSKNAHKVMGTVNCNVAETIVFDKDPITDHEVKNRFDDADDQLGTVLSRSDWAGTWPKARTDEERAASTEFIAAFENTAPNNPIAVEEMPTQGQKASLKLKDMIGLDYNDDKWEDLLNQITVSEMVDLCSKGAFQTDKIMRIGKPKTTDADGPAGFTVFMGDPTVNGTCYYASECVVASTWNKDLAYEMGKAVGNEGIWGNQAGDGMPYSGWYAPGINIHRTPFGGRNGEYYSEDGMLNGLMAANLIQGAMSKGVYTQIKHFALNDQETHRASGGLVTWVTEQAMREIYLKPFEIAVKKGGSHGMMSSFNRIGTVWAGGDYRLLTEVLRNEWGFTGMVISDFNTYPDYMNAKQMAYAGGDLNLANMPESWADKNNPTDVAVLRNCTKNILFAVANSNVMDHEVDKYDPPVWAVILYVVDAVVFAGLAVWGVFAVLKVLKKGKLPVQAEAAEQTD